MLKIIFSNMRKHKSSMVTLFMLILLSTMLLSIGFTTTLELNSFYNNKIDELNAPHLSYCISSPETDDVVAQASDFEGIKKIEVVDTMLRSVVITKQDQQDISSNFHIQNAEQKQELAPLTLIEESSKKQSNSVAIPLVFRDTYGYKTDDMIEFEINGTQHTYTIYGFFEDVYYGSPMMGYYRMFLYGQGYDELSSEGTGAQKMISIQMDDPDKTKAMTKHLDNILDHTEMSMPVLGLDMEIAKMGTTTSINIFAMILIGFSFIVVIVAVIVLSFSITTAVENGIQAIGILKSLGYRSVQVILSLVLQYGILAFSGGLLGILASMGLLPLIGDISASTVGLLWDLKPNLLAIVLSLSIIIGLVILVAVFSAHKTKKITPMMALRNGIETHNFKKNVFPLSKSRLNVNFGIVLKSIFGNVKQNAIILIIISSVTFSAVFSLQLYNNLVVDNKAFTNMMGVPLSDVWFTSGESVEVNRDAFEKIADMDNVSRVTRCEQILTKFENINMVGLYISDDFEHVNKKTIVDGRMPLHNNEIAISHMISKTIHKDIGDIMSFNMRGVTQEYLITGLTEQMSQMGFVIDITEGGFQRLDPNYETKGILIDLNEGVDTKEFITELESEYRSMTKSIMDVGLTLKNSTSSIEGGILTLMIAIIVIMIMVVALILLLIIKIKILRDKTNIGILKSLGFTSYQIISQIALNFTIVIGAGTILGGILGGLYTNNVVNLLLGGMGINNATFTTNYLHIACLVIAITLLCFVISSLVALKIKKITPYNLLIE